MLFAEVTQDWLDKAFNYGVPTAILAVIIVVAFYFGRWARVKIVEPLVNSHLAMVESFTKNFPAQTEELKRQTELLKASAEAAKKSADDISAALAANARAARVSADKISSAVAVACKHGPTQLPVLPPRTQPGTS